MIYHITTRQAWQAAQPSGIYQPEGYAHDGFIHCSDMDQVVAVANRLYTHTPDLIVLVIDPNKTGVPLVYENLEGGENLFPHLYGPLKADAVTHTFTFACDEQGHYTLYPAWGTLYPALCVPVGWGTLYPAWGTLYPALCVPVGWGTLYPAWGTLYPAWGTLYPAWGTLPGGLTAKEA